ncbi:hypothetical protein ALP99_200012 [Pseudomonas syringae pv. tomato]|nr:hypothetical protein PSTA9_05336 [Pseudomonas syringae pv. tomato]RMQ72232.1 hypothetical protein ALQ00_200119 [Pseudomonas syringae pv. tomato]RMQ77450.1 hypothetical protein ALP99_200012 [Pseudomonas syringae pv. tomato]
MWVEPLQEPVTDVVTVHAFGLDAGVGQTSCEALADVIQMHGRCLATERCVTYYSAIHDHTHPALLAAPRQFRNSGVLKKAAWFGDRIKVMFEEIQIQLRKRTAFGLWLDVSTQIFEVVIPAGFVFRVELDDPRRGIELVKTVLQRVFQCIAHFAKPFGITPLGADRSQFKECCQGFAIF